jgi:RNA-directed DNA polymerase
MLEEILDIRNIEYACKQVVSNKGAGGIDGMQTDELRDFLNANWQPFRSEILTGTYKPGAVRRVEIPKPQGGTRMLGIPTVKDRLIQQAIAQWMTSKWEPEFSPHSYGFRNGKNAHQAVKQAETYLNAGKTYVIELDLEKFFDVVNHDKLMGLLSRKIKDKGTLRLIGQYLRSGIMEGGVVSTREKGTPQGSPLSPLLSNILLNELDKELERRGLSFVRYADDCSIYVSSAKSAERVMRSITRYIETKLLLKVNRTKSKISRPTQSTLLGYSFYRGKTGWKPRIAPQTIERMKRKIKTVLKRNMPTSVLSTFTQLSQIVRGWVNYFLLADGKGNMETLDGFMCSRIRTILWHQWKRPKTRMRNLLKIGVDKRKAYMWANSSKGPCRVGHSPIMQTTINYKWLDQKGLLRYYRHYHQSKEIQLSLF